MKWPSEREKINAEPQRIIDEQTEPWGVKVSIVEVKDVELPNRCSAPWPAKPKPNAKSAPRSSTRRGRIPGEQTAEAAHVISREPVALQLRYLQTLGEIGTEKNTTIVFPLPIELGLLPDYLKDAEPG